MNWVLKKRKELTPEDMCYLFYGKEEIASYPEVLPLTEEGMEKLAVYTGLRKNSLAVYFTYIADSFEPTEEFLEVIDYFKYTGKVIDVWGATPERSRLYVKQLGDNPILFHFPKTYLPEIQNWWEERKKNKKRMDVRTLEALYEGGYIDQETMEKLCEESRHKLKMEIFQGRHHQPIQETIDTKEEFEMFLLKYQNDVNAPLFFRDVTLTPEEQLQVLNKVFRNIPDHYWRMLPNPLFALLCKQNSNLKVTSRSFIRCLNESRNLGYLLEEDPATITPLLSLLNYKKMEYRWMLEIIEKCGAHPKAWEEVKYSWTRSRDFIKALETYIENHPSWTGFRVTVKRE